MKFEEAHLKTSNERFSKLVLLEQIVKILSDEGRISTNTALFINEELSALYKEPLWLAIEQMKEQGVNEFSETISIRGNINSILTITLTPDL